MRASTSLKEALEPARPKPGEESHQGFVLCSEGASGTLELFRFDSSGIHGVAYLEELPPRTILKNKLHQVTQKAREQFESQRALMEPDP